MVHGMASTITNSILYDNIEIMERSNFLFLINPALAFLLSVECEGGRWGRRLIDKVGLKDDSEKESQKGQKRGGFNPISLGDIDLVTIVISTGFI